EDHVTLLTRVTEFLQILDGIQTCPAIGDVGIEIVLLTAVLIHGDSLEDEILGEVRLDATRLENRVCNPVLSHTVLDQVDADVDAACHFNSAAEGYLPVA